MAGFLLFIVRRGATAAMGRLPRRIEAGGSGSAINEKGVGPTTCYWPRVALQSANSLECVRIYRSIKFTKDNEGSHEAGEGLISKRLNVSM